MRRRPQGFTLIEIMVVIAIIAGLVTTVAIIVPKMQETQRQTTCLNNLQQLGHMYIIKALDNPVKARKYSGVSMWLNYRKGADDIKRGDEKILMCPGDTGFLLPETDDDRKKWDNVDLDNPQDGLCSFAGRDWRTAAISAETKDKEILGCDRQGSDQATMHHRGVIICVFDGGDAQKLTREELSLSSEEPTIKIGENAQNPMLKKVAYIVRKKD